MSSPFTGSVVPSVSICPRLCLRQADVLLPDDSNTSIVPARPDREASRIISRNNHKFHGNNTLKESLLLVIIIVLFNMIYTVQGE